MTYRTIVVHLGADARRRERLVLASDLAASFDAHLVALFAPAELLVPFVLTGNAGPVIESELRRRVEVAAEAKREFDAVVSRYSTPKAEWRSAEGGALTAMRLSARYADLVVVGQRDPDLAPGEGMPGYFLEELVLSAGRPVLVVPYAGRFPRIDARVLVAWNASREAARAVADALPLIADAEAVTVLTIGAPAAGEDDPASAAALVRHLLRHGIRAKAENEVAEDISVGDLILSRVADLGADLVVMGAFGHSRLRELVLGGVTRRLLNEATIPVLFSR